MPYRGVTENFIDKEQREAAEAALKVLTRDLDLNAEVRFTRTLWPKNADTSTNPAGCFEPQIGEPGIIWIKIGLSLSDTIHTVAHEAQHAEQQRWGYGRCSVEWREEDSERFAHRFMNAYGLRSDWCSARPCQYCYSRMILAPMRAEDVARWSRKVLYGIYSLPEGGTPEAKALSERKPSWATA